MPPLTPIDKDCEDGEQSIFLFTLGAMCVGISTILFAALYAT
jgi:hypothetical protein